VWQLTNGTWTQISLPTPETGATGHYIEGAACGPDGVCVAYGYVHGGTALWTLSNGVWTATLVPPPTGSTQADVWDVSCGTGGVCVLTGGYDTSATTSAGAVWVTRGGAWSVQPVPVPASAPAGTTTSAWWAACGWGPGAVCAVNGAAGTATLWTLTLDP
jgi:hypothetical protein